MFMFRPPEPGRGYFGDPKVVENGQSNRCLSDSGSTSDGYVFTYPRLLESKNRFYDTVNELITAIKHLRGWR